MAAPLTTTDALPAPGAPYGALRRSLVFVLAFAWLILLFVPMFPLLFVWPTVAWRQRVSRVYARWWSRGALRAAGIRVVVRGRERLATRPAVFLFNHTNVLDFFANACVAPPGCLVWGKRELVRVPFLGWMWLFGGHPMIDRKHRERWQGLMDWVQGRVATGRHSTMIAPEGTRSRDGRLQPFKKGPFHLALGARAPLVPVVIEGAHALLDARGGLRPGVLRLTVLSPVPTDGLDASAVDTLSERVRGLYLEALGEVEQPAEATTQPSTQPAS